MRELARIHKGGHVANPKVQIRQGTRVRVETFAPEMQCRLKLTGMCEALHRLSFELCRELCGLWWRKEMSDALQFVVILRKKSLAETSDKLKCVGHRRSRLLRRPVC